MNMLSTHHFAAWSVGDVDVLFFASGAILSVALAGDLLIAIGDPPDESECVHLHVSKIVARALFSTPRDSSLTRTGRGYVVTLSSVADIEILSTTSRWIVSRVSESLAPDIMRGIMTSLDDGVRPRIAPEHLSTIGVVARRLGYRGCPLPITGGSYDEATIHVVGDEKQLPFFARVRRDEI